MAHGSFAQASFISGEWASYAHGRFDLPLYKQALTVNLNAIILETGAWTKRSGTEIIGPTYLRQAAKFLPFESNAANPFCLEFTDGELRMWYNTGPVCTDDRQVLTASSSASGVISATTTSTHGWAVGDQFVVYCPSTITAANAAIVVGRQLTATAASGASLTLKDDMSVALPSDIASGGLNGATVIRVLRISTGIAAASLPNLRIVQAQGNGVILWGGAPQTLTVTTDLSLATSDADAVFSYATATFVDGPYGPLQPGGGSISGDTFTPSDGTTFSSSDVSRHIRLFSEPPAYNAGTTYSYGDLVKYNGSYWQSNQGSNTGNYPGTAPVSGGVPTTFWNAVANVQQWVWGTIATQATTSCTITFVDSSGTGGASGTVPTLNGSLITQWALGRYTSGSYPTCGVYEGGRLYLFGAAPNAWDASMSDIVFQFSPSDQYGAVNDNNGISREENFDELVTFYWAVPITQGILCGTNGGEVLLSSSSTGEAITPSTVSSKRVTKYRSAAVQALSLGISTVFVQRYLQRIMEYVETFNFTGAGFAARHLNEYAKHITAAGVKEISYQEEKAPVVWALTNDGLLSGCTYRRVGKFITDSPIVEAWHRHEIGDGSTTINSMAVLPATDGLGDRLYLNTLDDNSQYWVEVMRPIFEDA